MEVAVQPLETVDKVFGNIPLIGQSLRMKKEPSLLPIIR